MYFKGIINYVKIIWITILIACIKNINHNNSRHINGNVNTNHNLSKYRYEQGEKKPKDNDWNETGQNLKINNYDPTPPPTHLPTTLHRFEASWKTVM